jgi:hypothetical protein
LTIEGGEWNRVARRGTENGSHADRLSILDGFSRFILRKENGQKATGFPGFILVNESSHKISPRRHPVPLRVVPIWVYSGQNGMGS